MHRQSENTSRARAYPVSDARCNRLGPARSRRRGIQTRVYPASDAQSNRIGPAINMRRCKESLTKDCITKYRDDDWEEQRVGGPDENAKD